MFCSGLLVRNFITLMLMMMMMMMMTMLLLLLLLMLTAIFIVVVVTASFRYAVLQYQDKVRADAAKIADNKSSL